jgi:hypothetical protein
MSDRSDYMKSLVRGFAEGASKRLGTPLASLRKMLQTAIAQASSITDSQIAKALTRVQGVSEASAVCREERIWVEATSSAGLIVRFSMEPKAARFAPRGAKEIIFHVEPEEIAAKAFARDLVGAIAALVAHTLWGPFLGRSTNPQYDAIAEREGNEVRVDLRSVPAVRSAQHRGLGQLFDALELGRIEVREGSLKLHLKLPPLLAHP